MEKGVIPLLLFAVLIFSISFVSSDLGDNVSVISLNGDVIEEPDFLIPLPETSVQIGVSKAKASIGSKRKVQSLVSGEEVSLLEDEVIPWGVDKVKADEVWNKVRGDKIKVAILDTGIDSSHVELDIVESVSFIDGFPEEDFVGHGTMVAGVLGAKLDDEGIVGVAPEVEIYSVKVMNANGGFLSDILAGINWSIENDMDIISMSFGTFVDSNSLEVKVAEAFNSGILLVASSGNDGGAVMFPAAYSSVIAAGNVDENNNILFGNTGVNLEIVGPGTNILTTWPNDSYVIASGTSFSTPHVVGVAALLLDDEDYSVNDLREKLQNDALDLGVSGRDNLYGHGLVQVNLENTNTNQNNDNTEIENRLDILEAWREIIDETIGDIFAVLEGLISTSDDHEARIQLLENQNPVQSISNGSFPNYFKYLSSSDRKRIICGYGEDIHADRIEDLGWGCDFTYRETSRGERVSCRCKRI